MITTDTIMATGPCVDFPRARVDQLVAQYGPFPTWESLATVARDAGWPVSRHNILYTAYRAASPAQRELGVRHATGMQVEAQIRRCPDVSPELEAIRSRLLVWAGGGSEDIEDIRRDARDVSWAHPYSAFAAANTAAFAADAASRVASTNRPAYDSSIPYASLFAFVASPLPEDPDASLLFMCRLLDKDEK